MPYKDPQKEKAYKKAYYQKNKDRLRQFNILWIKEHPNEFRVIQKRYMATSKGKAAGQKKQRNFFSGEIGKIRNRRNNLRRAYKISLEEYDLMWAKQNGSCAICGKPEPAGTHLSVDHCHKMNKVRGLLCPQCNYGLGCFQDDTRLLNKAMDYLLTYIEPE